MDAVLAGLSMLTQIDVMIYLLLGIIAGLIVGAIPGLNDNIAFAVFIPFAFAMGAPSALAWMIGVYCSTSIGGAIPAIMVRVPGTASSLLTSLDGHTMARKGDAPLALSIAITSSVVGGLSSSVVLIFFAPVLALFALRFGPAENVALGLLGIAGVVSMATGSFWKGVLSAAIGLLIPTVGYHHGEARFTFGNFYLYDGVSLVPLLVGLFGVAAVLELIEEEARDRLNGQGSSIDRVRIGARFLSRAMVRRLWPTWARASLIGNIIGAVPGAGALLAIYLAYDQERRITAIKATDDDPDHVPFGAGAPEGVAAPEAANNAVVASSMVPLLSLGIPGNSVSALFIAALEIKGMTAGPLLFQRHLDFVWMILLSFLFANLVMGPIAYAALKWLIGIVYALPRRVLAAAIALLCLSGAYVIESTMFGIWTALLFGFLGYGFRRAGIPIAPIILAVILGGRIESSLFNALTLSKGSWTIFVDPVNHPISLVLVLASAAFLLSPLAGYWRRRRAA